LTIKAKVHGGFFFKSLSASYRLKSDNFEPSGRFSALHPLFSGKHPDQELTAGSVFFTLLILAEDFIHSRDGAYCIRRVFAHLVFIIPGCLCTYNT
jgi:hypothetical protein